MRLPWRRRGGVASKACFLNSTRYSKPKSRQIDELQYGFCDLLQVGKRISVPNLFLLEG